MKGECEMKKRSNISVMFKLLKLVKPLTPIMILAVFMGLVGNLAATSITVLGGYAVADIAGFDTVFSVKNIFIMILFFAVFRGLLRYAEQACNHYIAFKLLADIRDKVFKSLRKLAPAKLEGKDKGNLISVITSDIELLEVFYAHTISPVAIAFLFCTLLTILIGSFHWLLGVVALVSYIVIGVLVPVVVSKRSKDYGACFRKKSGNLSSFVLESLRGLSEIIQYGAGDKRLNSMNEKTSELFKEEKKLKNITGKNIAVTNSLILFFDILMLLTSAYLYKNSFVNFNAVLISTIALMSSFGPVISLANLGSTLQNTFASGNRVLDILEEKPKVNEIFGKPKMQSFDGAKVSNVTFSYLNENVLTDFSVEFPKNKIVGIVGKSGSGKSTLLKLLMNFWNVDKGYIEISNTLLENINTEDLRNAESYMTQETHLFHDSIANNLRIAKQNATDEELFDACKKASVHDFIMSLPDGYDTNIGELGDTLSGGERQRIGLAMAFLHDAPFVLLDEPTSNLDSLNEAIILKSLGEESSEKTVVLVSHRHSTMKIADCVYSVENGRIS